MARLFFALWPDETAAARLAAAGVELAARIGGKPVPAEKIHLTLAFLGEIAPDRIEAGLAAACEVRAAPFAMRLDRLGAFRGARVAWAGTKTPPAQLVELQADLAGKLAAAGFVLEERAFTPHLTLVRKVAAALPPETMPAVGWAARDFRLVRSEAGTGRYTELESWPLA